MEKLTIKDIARLANVSTAAVSYVLNDKKGVSDETRKKVSEIITKMNYTPNPLPRRLLLGRSNNIIVLFKKNTLPIEHLFHAELNTAILRECEKSGYSLIFSSYSISSNNVELPYSIRAHDVDGIIFYGEIDKAVEVCVRNFGIPYIVIDCYRLNDYLLYVSPDCYKAAVMAMDYLISAGHSDIAYIGTSSQPEFASQTFTGYKQKMEEIGKNVPLSWIQTDADDEQSASICMQRILCEFARPTAVFCAADIFAIGAILFLKQNNLKIPDDISVISIDDVVISHYIDPPLTTVRFDYGEMARLGIEILMKNINGEDVSGVIFPPESVIVRNSVRKINGF